MFSAEAGLAVRSRNTSQHNTMSLLQVTDDDMLIVLIANKGKIPNISHVKTSNNYSATIT